MVHTFQLCFWNECNYPMAFVYFIGGHAGLFLVLFANFYIKAYKPKPVSLSCSYKENFQIKLNRKFSFQKKKDKDGQALLNGDKKPITNGKVVSNGHANGSTYTNGKSHFYESIHPLETSYSSTRQRVFVERSNQN